MEKKKERLDKIRLDGLKFLRKNEVAILNLPVGFGKTRLVLDYLDEYLNEKENTFSDEEELKVAVFCPKSILLQWVKEIQNAFKVKHTTTCHGDSIFEVAVGIEYLRVFVVSNSCLTINKVQEQISDCGIWIFDEPKFLKAPTQARQYLIDFCEMPDNVILLDATVLENNYEEIDYLSDFLVLGGRDKISSATFSPQVPKLRKIEKRIIRVILREKKLRIKVRGHEKQLLAALKSPLLPKLQKYSRLRETLNFLSSLEEKGDPGEEKLAALHSLLANKESSPRRGIVFTRSLDTLKKVIASLGRFWPTAGIIGSMSAKQRQKVKEDFNSGKIDWIVTTKAGERGIDLFSGNTVVHFDLPYSQSSYRQRDRVTRRSSDLSDTTTIYTLLIKDSIEELQWQHIKCKMKMAAEARDGTFDFVPRESWTKFLEEKYS